jgi:hypothetical protein
MLRGGHGRFNASLPLTFVSALAMACGGKVDGTAGSQEPPPDPGARFTQEPNDGGSTTTIGFPHGTIAAGALNDGITFYPPGAVTGTAPIGTLVWNPASYVPQYMTFDSDGMLATFASLAIACGTLASDPEKSAATDDGGVSSGDAADEHAVSTTRPFSPRAVALTTRRR